MFLVQTLTEWEKFFFFLRGIYIYVAFFATFLFQASEINLEKNLADDETMEYNFRHHLTVDIFSLREQRA